MAVLPHLRLILDKAIAQDCASSISLWIGTSDEELCSMHAGDADNDTIYDLASLTKILGTTVALARASADGVVGLNEEPFKAWPTVKVNNLLAHNSGLAAHRKFYEIPGVKKENWHKNRELMMQALYEETVTSAFEKDRVYSDLNFLALGDLLEKRRKIPLWQIFKDTWAYSSFKEPFRYFASGKYADARKVASTGFCPYRCEHLKAQVNDLNCYFLGGLAGHAGLFGNLLSVALFGQYFLRCYRAPIGEFESTLRFFMRNRLGFDHPTANGSVRFLSDKSFGHFGYTGTSLWIDPLAHSGQGRIYVLLTNRIAKSKRPEPIFWLRKKVHELGSLI
jgi:serine-type D-Ala-D-Ala carboxypeptidase